MGYKNSRGSFKDYTYYVSDVRFRAIKTEWADDFEEEINSAMDQLEEDGYMVVGTNIICNEVYFQASIGYVPIDKVYFEDEEGGNIDGGTKQICQQGRGIETNEGT